jgi:hypothetical protein
MQGIPTVDDVRAWLNVSASAVPDDDLSEILVGELTIQTRLLRIPPDPDPETDEEATYPEALARALLRRCQRNVAARSVPLGAFGLEGSEFGPVTLPAWDAEISRLEASYLIPVVA